MQIFFFIKKISHTLTKVGLRPHSPDDFIRVFASGRLVDLSDLKLMSLDLDLFCSPEQFVHLLIRALATQVQWASFHHIRTLGAFHAQNRAQNRSQGRGDRQTSPSGIFQVTTKKGYLVIFYFVGQRCP